MTRYTGLEDNHVYLAVRGADLDQVAVALPNIMHANAQLEAFHRGRKPGLTVGDGT